jgi:hypothetical protein
MQRRLALARLVASKKFRNWGSRDRVLRESHKASSSLLKDSPVEQKHFSPTELAKIWGVSTETVRTIFRTEPGVLKLGKTGTNYRRGYVTLRIPQEVAERVHRRLSA